MSRTIFASIRLAESKMHGVAVGITLALGSTFLSQGCPLIGQCASCGACLPRLSLLAIPLAADAVVVLAGRLGARRVRPADPIEVAEPPDLLVTQDAAERVLREV